MDHLRAIESGLLHCIMSKPFRTRRDFLLGAAFSSLAPTFAGRAFAAAKNCAAPGIAPSGLDVRCCGAVGDGHHLDTTAINTAITTVAAHGGGIVRLPAGDYLTS